MIYLMVFLSLSVDSDSGHLGLRRRRAGRARINFELKKKYQPRVNGRGRRTGRVSDGGKRTKKKKKMNALFNR